MPQSTAPPPIEPPQTQLEAPVLLPFDTSFEHIGSVLAALGTNCFIPNLPTPPRRISRPRSTSARPRTFK
jgi:hypothetical protein